MSKDVQKLILFLAAILTIGIYMQFNMKKWKWPGIIQYDVAGYYAYLPSIFIHDDLATFDSMSEYGVWAASDINLQRYGLSYQPETGRYCNKYPIGVAVMQLPFFIAVHQYAKINPRVDATGYSTPYHKAIAFGNLIYVLIGLLFLGLLLRNFFPIWLCIVVLMIPFFGPNLYYYAIFETGMSHTYLFFLYAVCLWATMKFFTYPKAIFAITIGLCLGLAAVCRPTDILLAVFPLLWPVSEKYQDRWDFFRKNHKYLLIAFAAFAFPILLQMIYWQYATGKLLFFSYEGEGFLFSDPAIISGLFSYQKGWFVYTPMALLGFIGAIAWSFSSRGPLKDKKSYLIAFFIYYALSFYILFSWWMWHYGGSFGARVFVQSYALMALPLGFLLHRVYIRSRSQIIRYFVGILVSWFIFLNIFQTYQYHRGILHHDRITKDYYWRVFLKLEATEEDRTLLISDEEMHRLLEKRR